MPLTTCVWTCTCVHDHNLVRMPCHAMQPRWPNAAAAHRGDQQANTPHLQKWSLLQHEHGKRCHIGGSSRRSREVWSAVPIDVSSVEEGCIHSCIGERHVAHMGQHGLIVNLPNLKPDGSTCCMSSGCLARCTENSPKRWHKQCLLCEFVVTR